MEGLGFRQHAGVSPDEGDNIVPAHAAPLPISFEEFSAPLEAEGSFMDLPNFDDVAVPDTAAGQADEANIDVASLLPALTAECMGFSSGAEDGPPGIEDGHVHQMGDRVPQLPVAASAPTYTPAPAQQGIISQLPTQPSVVTPPTDPVGNCQESFMTKAAFDAAVRAAAEAQVREMFAAQVQQQMSLGQFAPGISWGSTAVSVAGMTPATAGTALMAGPAGVVPTPSSGVTAPAMQLQPASIEMPVTTSTPAMMGNPAMRRLASGASKYSEMVSYLHTMSNNFVYDTLHTDKCMSPTFHTISVCMQVLSNTSSTGAENLNNCANLMKPTEVKKDTTNKRKAVAPASTNSSAKRGKQPSKPNAGPVKNAKGECI